ncbi:MAG: acetate/propionate family kinase [Armatimonadetes bacterium]|nr:acetate/propionate family kinase [Armatimonadota bacterium]
MTILVLNAGSSSLKCQVFAFPAGCSVARAGVERVGQAKARLKLEREGAEPVVEERGFRDHLEAIERVLELLHAGPEPLGIDAVGHRVVHAAEAFTGSVPVTPAVLEALETFSHLAPLHNPPNLAGIRACLAVLPGVPMVCVFDNALHHTLAEEVWLCGLPRRLYTDERIRRYGFHGVAFRSIFDRVTRLLGRPLTELRVVSLMLGSGCTANAFDRGRSVSISTGFTPPEGLVQSTRCGDLDAGCVVAMLRAGWPPARVGDLLNRESGLKGVSQVGPDARDIEEADTPSARLAEAAFVHRAVQYVGGYTADMGGLDVLAFGGGIGQNAPAMRAAIGARMSHLGLRLDAAANAACVTGAEGIVSAADSRVAVVVTAVDEEWVIARDTYEVVTG